MAMLSTVGDGHTDVLAHALSFVSLNVEQGMRMYTTVRRVREPQTMNRTIETLPHKYLSPAEF